MTQQEMLMRQWVDKLNQASEAYYNGKGELMSDYEWDALFDRLKLMEEETGITLPDSPTAKVSEDNVAGQKEEHEFPALSLAKTKSVAELVKWADGRCIWLSWKLDGLTLVVTYDNGRLTKVVTRGNGHIGTNITHLAPAIAGIPQQIDEMGHLVIRGEAVISYPDFEQNRALLTNPDGTYTERGKDVIRQTPFGRMGKPEELCGTIQYLMSDAASFVTGTVAVVDGGFNIFAM